MDGVISVMTIIIIQLKLMHVICHQLGYTGASSYSRAGLVRYVSSSL